ncbi:unnamed protein product [Porites evermanni]|uniref:Uncharacterized protein n=1 Tax=Porites evermanni TaxID=104178 RepID=A0ABN8QTK9_9CNID|nr:unnamed protein product [Porites evermanni]
MQEETHRNHFRNNHFVENRKSDNNTRLQRLESCPPWLQFNKYILNGYRCNLSTPQCVESLFYIHNESFNIYSHGIPCAVILVLIPLTASAACLADPVWFFFHFFACFAPFFASPKIVNKYTLSKSESCRHLRPVIYVNHQRRLKLVET